MGTKFSTLFRCTDSKRILTAIGAFALLAFLLGISPQPTLAQSGVDNSTASGLFQMEGDAQRTGTICWLPVASGGPAIATPVTAGTNLTDGNGCPTVNPSSAGATWSLISFGSNTDDWSSFAYSNGVFTSKAHSLFDPAFDTDAVGSLTDNTFLGSSSKDTQDISQWTWNPHGVQDKDDIAHAYAGAYHLANGDTAIYAGMDRFSNAGDATAGFWFVQDSTFALCTGFHLAGSPSGNVPNNNCTAAGTFVGTHTDGDLLIVSDFSQGGAVSTINIFTWSSGTLVLTKSLSPAPCNPLNGGSDFCGLVNNAFTQVIATSGKFKGQPVLSAVNVATGGWPFNEKTQSATSFVTGEFLEIGVDLNKIFSGALPCFSTFFSETRSSTAATASLSDLTTPVSFPLCSLSVNKTCDSAQVVNGNQVKYNFSGDVTNTGSSTLYKPVVYDTPPSASLVPNSLAITQPIGPIPGNSSTNGHYTGSFVSTSILSSSAKNRVSAAASSNMTGTPLNVVCGANPPTSDTDECSDWGSACSPPVTPGLTLAKLCATCLTAGTSDIHVQVNEAFKVCNTGNVNITGITIKDCEGGTYSGTTCSGTEATIATGVSLGAQVGNTPTCQTFSHTYTPTSTGVCTGSNCSLHDEAFASGTGALGSGTITTPASGADCTVCPINTTCSTPTF
jgi:hypothetical protein